MNLFVTKFSYGKDLVSRKEDTGIEGNHLITILNSRAFREYRILPKILLALLDFQPALAREYYVNQKYDIELPEQYDEIKQTIMNYIVTYVVQSKWSSSTFLRILKGINPDPNHWLVGTNLKHIARGILRQQIHRYAFQYSREFIDALVISDHVVSEPELEEVWENNKNRVPSEDEELLTEDLSQNPLSADERHFVAEMSSQIKDHSMEMQTRHLFRLGTRIIERPFAEKFQWYLKKLKFCFNMQTNTCLVRTPVNSVSSADQLALVKKSVPQDAYIEVLQPLAEGNYFLVSLTEMRGHEYDYIVYVTPTQVTYNKYYPFDERYSRLNPPTTIEAIIQLQVKTRWYRDGQRELSVSEQEDVIRLENVNETKWKEDKKVYFQKKEDKAAKAKAARNMRQEKELQQAYDEMRKQKILAGLKERVKHKYAALEITCCLFFGLQIPDIENLILKQINMHLIPYLAKEFVEEITQYEFGCGKARNKQFLSDSIAKIREAMICHEMDASVLKLTGSEFRFADNVISSATNTYFVLRRKDDGNVAWLSRHLPDFPGPSPIVQLRKIVGFEQQSHMTNNFPHGLHWSEFTVWMMPPIALQKQDLYFCNFYGDDLITSIPFQFKDMVLINPQYSTRLARFVFDEQWCVDTDRGVGMLAGVTADEKMVRKIRKPRKRRRLGE